MWINPFIPSTINRLLNDFITLKRNLHSLASLHSSTFGIYHISRAKFYNKNLTKTTKVYLNQI